jgi:glycosyltransferase involved in cell wall biosynthesis
MISGVSISQSQRSPDQQRPTPDYQILIDTFHPDIIDIHTIHERMNPLLQLVEQRLGVQWAIALCAFQNRKHYSAILATGEDIGLPLAFLAKSTRTHIPLIITCHNISTRRPTFFLKRLGVGSAVRTFQCLSQTQATMLKEQSSISHDRIQMIYWHVDHDFFQPMPEVPVRAQICSAGMASRDYATLVAAVDGLEVDLKIAADSPWFTQKLNITAQKLPTRVEVRSYGNYAALRQLYAESQFVVVPLFDVNFSAGYTVILEAMAMGKPVIVTKIRQRDDFIIDGWNGLYVAPGNVAELHDRIRFLIEHPDEVRRMGENARKTIEERFTLSHFVERMRTAITGVMP